ncbi:MAG: hypothetical protein AAF085_00955 [Planctomycetota bacterium]
MSTRWTCCRAMLLAAVVLLAGWLATPAEAQRREDPLAELTSAQKRVFQNYTRLYCQQFFRFEENRFVLLPNYERQRENSTGKTYKQAVEEMTVVKQERRRTSLGTKMMSVKYPPPSAEVIMAARVIPAIEVGHYGFVNSVTIKEIVGADEMIVSNIELVPRSELGSGNNSLRKAAYERQKQYAFKSYRVLGFNTDSLKAGDKYYGPRKKGLQLAVMSTDPQCAFVLVNYDKLERVRTNEFHEALNYVQISPPQFIEMVRKNREASATEGDKMSLITIYGRYYNRYRPKRLSSTFRGDTPKPEPVPVPDRDTDPAPGITFGDPDSEPELDRDPDPGTTFPDRYTDPEPEPEPEPKPRPKPEPEEDDEEEDDWDADEDTQDKSDTPTFFGIPL